MKHRSIAHIKPQRKSVVNREVHRVSCMLMGSLLLPTCPFYPICPWLFGSLGFGCRESLPLFVAGIYLFTSLDNPQRSCLSQHCHLGVGIKEEKCTVESRKGLRKWEAAQELMLCCPPPHRVAKVRTGSMVATSALVRTGSMVATMPLCLCSSGCDTLLSLPKPCFLSFLLSVSSPVGTKVLTLISRSSH